MSKISQILVAIVGQPNVGKSTLFNRLIGQKHAIETPIPGTTRDRLYDDIVWRGRDYLLMDTAGILFGSHDDVGESGQRATELAMEEADVILFVVDFKQGITQADLQISKKLRREKNVILVINKCDNKFDTQLLLPFKRLGLEKMTLVSAVSGRNTGDLLDMIHDAAHNITPKITKDADDNIINLAIIGRPNAGKSTLLNSIIGEKKMIVSSTPGTTRDSQNYQTTYKNKVVNLIDTAGIRKKSKIQFGSIEGYAQLRSIKAIRDSNVVVYLLDASAGIVSLDQSLLGEAAKQGKSIILAVNKIDLWADAENEMAKFIAKLQSELNFMPWLPIIFVSAKNQVHLNNLLNQSSKVFENRFLMIESEVCTQILLQAKENNGQIEYMRSLVQERSNPAVFKIKTHKNKKPHFSHLRYLENRIRDYQEFRGNPIFIDWLRR